MPLLPENMLKALYDTLPDPVLIVDGNRTILAANAAATQKFGYSAEELVGMSAAQFYASSADAQDVGGELYPLSRGTSPVHRRLNLRRKDGSVFPGELTVSPMDSAEGEPIGVVALIRDLSEIYKAQEDRLRAETILNTALGSISDGFVVYDDQDRLVLCNDAYRKIYSISAPAIKVGRTFESVIRYGLKHGQYPDAGDTPEAHETWLQIRLVRHNNPGEPFVQEICPNRSLLIEERVTDENYRVGVRTDITAIQQIKTEAERLGLIIEGVEQEIYLASLTDEKIISANKSARDNLQYSMEELREICARDFSVGLTQLEMSKVIAPIVSGEAKVKTFDTWHRRKDGSTYPCRVRLELMADTVEPVALAFVEDMTERIEIEQAIARKEHEFETLVQNLPDFIARATPDTTLTYVNANYARFTGHQVDDLIGRKFLDFIPHADQSVVMELLQSLSPENPIRTSEQEMVGRDGEKLWYFWSNLMVFENGVPVELVSVGRDITQSREAQNRITSQSRELELRNAALEQFSGIVSHDLKAPLRQIRLFADMIAEDVSEGRTVDLETFSDHISDRSKAMERMVSNLLEYSQLAYQEVNPESFQLSRAVAAAWDNLAVIAAESQAILVSEDDILVVADINLMVQLFQNLFANSMKYCEPGKPVTIRVSAETGQKGNSIAVEDSGIGIDPAESERIFGVFQRLHNDEKHYPGSGIGLALCRRISESHGGSIALDPSYQDGARFVITLPAST